jgi:hypothetical protein
VKALGEGIDVDSTPKDIAEEVAVGVGGVVVGRTRRVGVDEEGGAGWV